MTKARNLKLPAVLASTLGILAACDLSDSPDRTGAAVTTTFAPRILAPAEGVRQATFVVLNVWSSSGNNKWDSVYQEDLISAFQPSITVKNVPLRKALRFRLAGYVTTYPDGIETTDTVWTAVKENFSLSSTTPLTQPTTVLAQNWAIAPVSPFSRSTVLKPGSPLTLKTSAGQRLSVDSSAQVSCEGTTPADTAVQLVPLLDTSFSVWVRTCSDDPKVLPSSPRNLRWSVDTNGVGRQLTPLAPKPVSGFSDFDDFSRVTSLESDPTQTMDFGASGTSVLAWNLSCSPETSAPVPGDFPPVPSSHSSARFDTAESKFSLWPALKDSLLVYRRGMRVLATLVRTDVRLGKEWVSSPTRFWFNLVPPPLPTRFQLESLRWDSASIEWDLSRTDLEYRAFRHPGEGAFDSTAGTPLPDSLLKVPFAKIGSLPSNSALSIMLVVRDPRTGLKSSTTRSTTTRALPALSVPTMTTPSAANPVTLKPSLQKNTKIQVADDSAGTPLTFLYVETSVDTAGIANPLGRPWPTVSGPSVKASSNGQIETSGQPGQYVYLSIVATDGAGRVSEPLQRLFKIVAESDVVMPDAPTGLRLSQRDTNALTFSWNAMQGFRYRLRYSVNGQRETEADTTSNIYRITGLKPGDSVTSIAVRALDNTNAQLISPYSQAIPIAFTKRPPPVPDRPEASWIAQSGSLKLRLVWTRAAGTTNQISSEQVTGSTNVPPDPTWVFRSKTHPGVDTVEIPYADLQKGAFFAFGVRAIQDSLASAPAWQVAPIPRLAPAFDPDAFAWQKGDTVKVSFSTKGADASFDLKARISQLGLPDTTLVVTSNPGILPLGSFKSGKISGQFWWERRDPTNVAAFDRGLDGRIEQQILPAPTGFALLPGPTEKDWIFQPPTGLDSNAIPMLVVRTSREVKLLKISVGETVTSTPSEADTFQLVQVVGRDTSFATLGRTLRYVTTAPTSSPPQGSYLFPFAVSMSSTLGGVQLQSATDWKDYSGAFDPFALGTFNARIAGPFTVGAPKPFEFRKDSTFNDLDWAKRFDQATEGTLGKTLVSFDSGTIRYTPSTSLKVPATIVLSQQRTGAPATIAFAVDPVNNSTYDASFAKELVVRSPDSLTKKIGYALVIASRTSKAENIVYIPMLVDGKLLRAPLAATTATTLLPWVVTREGKKQSIAWTGVSAYLSDISWVGIQVDALTTGLTGAVEFSSISFVGTPSRF